MPEQASRMSAELFACPYCNARVSPSEVQTAQGRRICPRCGEPLPGWSGDATAQTASRPLLTTGSQPGAQPSERFSRRFIMQLAVVSVLVLNVFVALRFLSPAEERVYKTAPLMIGLSLLGLVSSVWLWFFRLPRSNQATLRFVLGNMALMIGVALSYALWTTPQRRQNDPRDERVRPVAPGQLAALGYLPSDAILIAGLHVRELLQEPAGTAFLEQPQWGLMHLALKNVEKWTGLGSDAIDHIALGVRESDDVPRLKEFLFPNEKGSLPRSLTVVVQTRRVYNPDTPPDALKRMPASQLHAKPLYRFQPMGLQGLLAQGLVWCAGDKTLVLVLWSDGSDLDTIAKTIPARLRSGAAGLRKPLRDAVEQRLSAGEKSRAGVPLWLAGHETSPRLLGALLPFPRILSDMPKDLAQVRTFTIALRFDKQEVTMQGDLQVTNESSVRALQKYLESQTLPGIGTATVFSTLPEPNAAQEHWVTFQLRSEAETLFSALGRAKGPFGLVPLR